MASLDFARRAGPAYTQKSKNKHKDARAQNYKYQNKCRDARANIKVQQSRQKTRRNKQNIQQTIQEHIQIQISKNKRTTSKYAQKTNRGETSGQTTRRFSSLRARLSVQIRKGLNYETGRCSGVRNGTESSLLTHFRGVPEKGKVPITESRICLCPVMTSKKNATVSLASGNVRKHEAVRVGSCFLRENAVRRQAAYLIVSTVLCYPSAVFPREKHLPTHDVGSK